MIRYVPVPIHLFVPAVDGPGIGVVFSEYISTQLLFMNSTLCWKADYLSSEAQCTLDWQISVCLH